MAIICPSLWAQPCTPAGDETAYGNSNVWIGYIYDNQDFTAYSGFVTEGNAGSPNFDQNFSGDYVNYATSNCNVYTETFSARYRLSKTFTAGQYQFVVGADDGYRLSLDGGATWIINHWNDQAYTYTTYATTLNGTYDMVLEYYENGGGNRVSFSVATLCSGTEDESIYGSGDVWRGYIYTGTNFNNYSGLVTEGIAGNPNFDESFGGDNTFYNTSACGITTEQFSARYRLQKTFLPGTYIFTAGGDDGYRLSIDGGITWVIDNWGDHGYAVSGYTATLGGTYDMVLEYYENGGGNRVSFGISGSLLPVTLLNFEGKAGTGSIGLNWQVSSEINNDYYLIEKSSNGLSFTALGKVYALTGTPNHSTYHYTDPRPLNGTNYYRLRMTDRDGKYSYSPIIKIEYNTKQTIRIYPAVVENSPVYLTSTTELPNGRVNLFDMTGKKLQEIRLPALLLAGQTLVLPLKVIRSGSYVLVCQAGDVITHRQVIIFR
ncbi:MAG: PA14 domain-containing protein [Bacteroidota bacterium]